MGALCALVDTRCRGCCRPYAATVAQSEQVDHPRPCLPRTSLYHTPISTDYFLAMEACTSSSSGSLHHGDMPTLDSAHTRAPEASVSLSEDAEKRPTIERDPSKYPPASQASSSAYFLNHESEARDSVIPRRLTRAWNGLCRRVEVRHPRVHRVGLWLRGPRPKVDIPRM